MVRRTIVFVCLIAAHLAARAPSALASGEPQESFLYQNFVRASEILDRAIAAHGGAALIDRSVSTRLTLTGTYRYEAHYQRPWAHKDYRLNGSVIYSPELRSLKAEVLLELERKYTSFTIVGPKNGVTFSGSGSPDSIPEKDLADALNDELEVLPHEFLRQARAGAAGLRWLSGANGHDVICYTLENDEGRALFFDPNTHLLMRVERIGHWEHKGDRLEWRTFGDYFDHDGIQLPRHTEAHVEQSSTQAHYIVDLAKIELGGAVNADELTIPADFRKGFEQWTLETPAPQRSDTLLVSHDLGKGVHVIELPTSTARSLLVSFSDFSVIVEAGDHSEISERVLATAEHLLPGKPVRYVAMTHHHPLYANGLRPYVRRGVTILTTPGNADYYRDLGTRPYRIHPDEQHRKPLEPKIEVFDKVRIIKDGKQRLELHPFGHSTHTDEYVLPYVKSHKLIVTGDMVYLMRGEKAGRANVRELAIHRVVEERKLDVEAIMQTWFLQESDHTVPYAALEEKVRLANTKAAK